MKPQDELDQWGDAWKKGFSDHDPEAVAVARRSARVKKLKARAEMLLTIVVLVHVAYFGLVQQRAEWWLWCATAASLVAGFQWMAIRIRRQAARIIDLATEAALAAKLAQAHAAMKLARLNLVATVLLIPLMLPLVISLLQKGEQQAAFQMAAAELLVIGVSLLWSRSVWRKGRWTVRLLENHQLEQ